MKRSFTAIAFFIFLLCCTVAKAQPVASVTVSETSGSDTICAGTSVTMTALPVNGGVNPAYAWFVNGRLAAISGGTYTTDSLPAGESYIYCIMNSNLVGVTGNPATSDTVYLDVIPRPAAMISDSDTICSGQSTQLIISLANGAPWRIIYSAGSILDTVIATSSPYFINASPSVSTSYHITSVSVGGCASQASDISGTGLIVVNPSPVASITPLSDSSECLSNNSFGFNGSHSIISSGSITGWSWSFGALSPDTASGPSPLIHFSDTGTRQPVSLMVTSNKGCMDTTMIHITIKASPNASFNISDTALCIGNSLATEASAAGDSMYIWSWGDGTDSSCQCLSLSHTYNSINDKRLRLTVTAGNGCVDTSSQVIHVHAIPQVTFAVSDTVECFQGNFFSFTDHSSITGTQQYRDSISSYVWNFGDGSSTDTTMNPIYSYSNNVRNTYAVVEVVTTSYGCTGSFSRDITIYETPSAQIVNSLGSDTICSGLSYRLITVTNASRPAYRWSDPDSTTSYVDGQSETTGNLSNTVNYIVTVTDSANNKCTNTAVLSLIYVPNIEPPLINGGLIPVACDSSTVLFFASNASDSVSYFWHTTPALPISGQNEGHSAITFSASDSVVLVYLTATNPWGCAAASHDTIRPVAAASPMVSIVSVPDLSDTTLIASVTPDSGISYQWGYDIGASGSSILSGATAQDLLLDSGQNSAAYWVMVTDTTTHCSTLGYVVPPVTTTGINGINGSKAEVSVYPDPTADIFKVCIQSANDQIWSLEITDISGRQITATISTKERNTVWEINASSWAPGTYLLRIGSVSGDTQILKLIRE